MRVALTTGAYEARSIIASAQRCVNLFIEKNPKDSPYPFTHYPTPGLLTLATAPLVSEVRGLYTASNNHLYGVVANKVYDISGAWVFTPVGTIGSSTGIVSMKDNTLALVIVDGSASGWAVNLANNAFGTITGDSFYGSNRVDYLDTFLVFNRPGTNQFYISLSNVSYADLTGGPIITGAISAGGTLYTNGVYSSVALTGGSGSAATADITVTGNAVTTVTIIDPGEGFRVGDVLSAPAADLGGPGSGFTYTVSAVGSSAFDPLDIAAKTGGNDLLQAAAVMHREISLIGVGTSEVWYNSGAADFAFQAMPGAFIEHGCQAVSSIAKYDLALYFLGQDAAGNSVVYQESGYKVDMVSTRAIANEITSYAVKSDAIGFCYLQEGHVFYVLTFPTEDVTWVYDVTEQHWHQRSWSDSDGNPHRWRANCLAVFNNKVVVGDFENGNIYAVDLDTYQDLGGPIVRTRSFPHLIEEGDRVTYWSMIAEMEVGDQLTTGTTDSPSVSLRMSDNAGRSYGDAIIQSMGQTGEYLTSIQFNRLGLARDRVFELSWSAPMKTSLNGAYIEIEKAAS